MQDTCVGTTGNDGFIGMSAGSLSNELVNHFCFQLEFHDTRSQGSTDALKRISGNTDCRAHGFDFLGCLDHHQITKDRLRSRQRMQGEFLPYFLGKPVIPGWDRILKSFLFISIQIQYLGLHHQGIKNSFHLIHPQNRLNATQCFGFFLGEFGAFPGNQVFIRTTDKQNFFVLLLGAIRKEDQSGFFLIDAR